MNETDLIIPGKTEWGSGCRHRMLMFPGRDKGAILPRSAKVVTCMIAGSICFETCLGYNSLAVWIVEITLGDNSIVKPPVYISDEDNCPVEEGNTF